MLRSVKDGKRRQPPVLLPRQGARSRRSVPPAVMQHLQWQLIAAPAAAGAIFAVATVSFLPLPLPPPPPLPLPTTLPHRWRRSSLHAHLQQLVHDLHAEVVDVVLQGVWTVRDA